MKRWLLPILVALRILPSTTFILKSRDPSKGTSLIEAHKDLRGSKLIPELAKKQWLWKKHNMRVHMLSEPEQELPEIKAPEIEAPEIKVPGEVEDVFSPGTQEEEEEAKHKHASPAPASASSRSSKKLKPGCIHAYPSPCNAIEVIYGKYQSIDGDQSDNTYYLFKDPNGPLPAPVAIQFHAGGFFSGGPWKTENEEVKTYLSKGFSVVSVGYRLAAQKYFYESEEGSQNVEELIDVSKDGNLSLSANETMDDYQVLVGKQEFITKLVYDAVQVMENLIKNQAGYGLDMHRVVFIGESSGGAAIQYLTWVYHKLNKERYTPRGIVFHNAQLNYPVTNMLGETWDLFSQTMGPQVKLSDVVSEEACPTVVGNPMCNSVLGNASDYNLCNEEWNARSLKEFCGEARKTATLGQARARQEWPGKDDGMGKLWYASENMQDYMPSSPFYIYVANAMNGTDAVDVAHHSVFALNFAKFAEMGDHGGHEYTVYYTDFAHMSDEDRGAKRYGVKLAPSSLRMSEAAMPVFSVGPGPSPAAAPSPTEALPLGLAPAPSPFPMPAPGPAFEVDHSQTVFNYLSTHGWREDVAEAQEVEAASMEERVLYAAMAAGVGPFAAAANTTNTTNATKDSNEISTTAVVLGVAIAGAVVVGGIAAATMGTAAGGAAASGATGAEAGAAGGGA